MPENSCNPQENSQGSNASMYTEYARTGNDLSGRVNLDGMKGAGHQYTKNELKKLGKGTVIEIVMALQEIVSGQAEELRKASLTIESLRAMIFGPKSDKGRYVAPDDEEEPPADGGKQEGENAGDGAAGEPGHGQDGGNGGKGRKSKKRTGRKTKDGHEDPAHGRQHYGRGGSSREKPHRKKGCQAKKREELPAITVTHTKTEEELIAEFGTLEGIKAIPSSVTQEVIRIPEQLVVVNHQFMSYVKGNHFASSGTAGSIKLIPGSDVSPSLMASILYDRFFRHMPMNRITETIRSWGYKLGRDTIPRWSILMTEKGLEQYYLRLIELLLEHGHIQVDETYFRVVHDGRGQGSQSYMWVMLPSECDPDALPLAVYVFDETRSTDVLRQTLGNYKGCLTSDGYIDYPVFAKESGGGITLSTCWAHVRGKFANVAKIIRLKEIPVKNRAGIPCHEALERLKAIFREEKKLKCLTPEERLEGRKKHIAPLVDQFFAYIRGIKEEGNATADAISYTLNMEASLRAFLSDPLIPMTNSNCERGALFFALGRNGFKQKDSLDGAYADSIYYSIAATAKMCGVNGFLYFQYLLEKLPALMQTHERRTGGGHQDLSYLDVLMPWGEDYKAYERGHLMLRGEAAKEYVRALYAGSSAA